MEVLILLEWLLLWGFVGVCVPLCFRWYCCWMGFCCCVCYVVLGAGSSCALCFAFLSFWWMWIDLGVCIARLV